MGVQAEGGAGWSTRGRGVCGVGLVWFGGHLPQAEGIAPKASAPMRG